MQPAVSKEEAESTDSEDARPGTPANTDRLSGEQPRDPYLNKVIAERYEIESYLGQGSMGTVYRCRHRMLDNHFAVKILRQELMRETEAVSRFFTEARAASAIGSKHIVEVFDFGELPTGAAYILMEYLRGQTLFKELERSFRLPATRAIEIGVQMADALGAAHAASIVHRDLKPDNVFLCEAEGKDFVKVLDFGIAKVLRSQSKLTQAGTVIGTPAYMSPEQALGAETDHRCDIYALGIMLYEMACGEVPFNAENPLAVLSKQVSEEPRPLSDRLLSAELPEGYEAVIAKCLAKHPNDRFQSMQELKAALSAIASGIVPEVGPVRQSWRPSISTPHLAAVAFTPGSITDEVPFLGKRWPRKTLFAGGVGVAALVALVLGLSAGSRSEVTPLTPNPQSPVATTAPELAPSPGVAPPAPASELREVHIVVHPIDARVYDGTTDLGEMPVSVKLRPGEKKEISVARRGYVTRRITVDGSSSRVVAGLVLEGARDSKQAQRAADIVAEKNASKAATKAARPPVIANNPFDDNPYERERPRQRDNPYGP